MLKWVRLTHPIMKFRIRFQAFHYGLIRLGMPIWISGDNPFFLFAEKYLWNLILHVSFINYKRLVFFFLCRSFKKYVFFFCFF